MSNIKQNLFFAFVYNVAGIRSRRACSIAHGWLLSPMLAALAMSCRRSR